MKPASETAAPPYEIEVKLRLDDLRSFDTAQIGLTLVEARHFEENWLLDTTEGNLRRVASVLRVRTTAGKTTLTLKAQPPAGAVQTQFKARIELETAVADATALQQILAWLGYRPWFRYQKWRTTYAATLPDGQRLELMFDETPLGNFVELEGSEEAITTAVALLGLTPREFINASYLALQRAHCEAQGRAFTDLLFAEPAP